MKTGVIGLGAMGAPMARNLAIAGHLRCVWNRDPRRLKQLAGELATTAARDLAALAGDAELIVMCVSRDADVLEIIDSLLPVLHTGTIVVDTSTVSAGTARTAAARLKDVGCHFLDCPVSGGVEGATNGTLAMMVGGDPKILDQARPTLAAIAAKIVYIGVSGMGQATKAVNQIMAAGIAEAVTEALAFGVAQGLDMDKVIDVVGSGAAANWFLDHRGRTMISGDFSPGFKLNLHHKDLEICQAMATTARSNHEDPATAPVSADPAGSDLAAPLPVVAMTLKDYAALIAKGHGDEDISALYRIKSAGGGRS